MKRPLRPLDRLVRVPLGLLWFGVLALLAIPVLLYMSALYYVARLLRSSSSGDRPDPGATRPEAI